MVEFATAGEGLLDGVIVERILAEVRGICGAYYGANGKIALLQRLKSYNEAARLAPWFVLIDLDADADCAPTVIHEWLPNPAPQMHLRVAVKAVESWLLADPERFAKFLSIPEARIPVLPEQLDDPKGAVVELARRSKNRSIREDLIPRPASGRRVGAAYTSRLAEFISDKARGWRPRVAAANALSLNRCLGRLERAIAAKGEN